MKTDRNGLSSQGTFARLYDEYLPRVFRYIHFKVNDQPLTEDLTSMVFEKALVNFDRYSSDRASFATWIFSIARNTVIDYYRSENSRQTVSADEPIPEPTDEVSPEEEAEKGEEQRCLQTCLSRLSQQEQEIIQLKFSAEYNNRQIAKMIGLSESNVGIKLFRAIRKLRDNFRELQDG